MQGGDSQLIILDDLRSGIKAIREFGSCTNAQSLDPSAIVNGWQTIKLFSATVTTNTTLTGPTINVKPSSSQTIMIDVTAVGSTGATGLTYSLRSGLSGLGFFVLRSTTAGLGTFAFKVAQAGVTTGATADTTGATRYDDMFLQFTNPATATGGSVTIRAKAFLSPTS